METVELSTLVHLPPEEVYDFLVDFPRYANYSEHLREVRRHGDGSPGTEYDLEFAWWKLTYTARSRVVAAEPPERIDWKLVKDVDAAGAWEVEEAADEAPPDAETASRVVLRIQVDVDSARGGLGLPRFVSFDWVVEKLKPKLRTEAEAIVERIVADLEGQRRSVDLRIHTAPDG
ncbi:type II toxin-antitoxin system RatA family toxin [Halostella salina]|uniref:type II toxin-antitoxin system RatA family toxin n=1 Tax=Halostella salina TaxID=1547897 RepID=UPI000EF7E1A7|nr:SRPBCC family protein [Halostella salina]